MAPMLSKRVRALDKVPWFLCDWETSKNWRGFVDKTESGNMLDTLQCSGAEIKKTRISEH